MAFFYACELQPIMLGSVLLCVNVIGMNILHCGSRLDNLFAFIRVNKADLAQLQT